MSYYNCLPLYIVALSIKSTIFFFNLNIVSRCSSDSDKSNHCATNSKEYISGYVLQLNLTTVEVAMVYPIIALSRLHLFCYETRLYI